MIAVLLIGLSLAAGVGGWSDEKSVDEKVMSLANSLREEIESQVSQQFSVFTPVVFKSQVVAGINYKIKIEVDNAEYIHVSIYVPLRHTESPPRVSEVVRNMGLNDHL